MEILFIQDNALNESLALTELSASLKSLGHECDLLIEKEEGGIVKKVKKASPDLVIIPFGIFAHNFALDVARKIKGVISVPVVFGGAHPTFYPEIIYSDAVDIVCRGEADYPILELVDKLEKGGDIKKIRGLWVKKGGKIHRNPLGNLVKDLDQLPMPDRELYYKYSFIKDLPMKRFMSGRGCPHSCGYCFNSSLRGEYQKVGCKKYVRKKSVERVIEEISHLKDRCPLKHVHFSDDLFTYDKKWLKEFCLEYKKEIGLPFTFNTTADQINREVVKCASKAGCSGIAVGIETGNEKLRRVVLGKHISNRQIITAGKLIKEAGLNLTTFNMLANPGETIEDAFLTIRLNQKISVDNPRVTISVPIPKTRLYYYAVENGYLDGKDIQKIGDIKDLKPVYKSKDMDRFENLFYLFRIGCKSPQLTSIIKRLIKLSKNKFFRLVSSLFPLYEKKFFNITLISGLRYYYHTGNPYLRTSNYPILI